MNNNTLIITVIVILVVIGGIWLFGSGSAMPQQSAQTEATSSSETATSSTAAASSSALMQSTGEPFSKYAYIKSAHQVFPKESADLKKTMGPFGYTKEDLGNNTFRITPTLTNRQGYVGQSVTVTGDQSVYFIERSPADDTDTEDSFTTDDFLIAVDANGNILK